MAFQSELEVVFIEGDGFLKLSGSFFQLLPILLAKEQLRQFLLRKHCNYKLAVLRCR